MLCSLFGIPHHVALEQTLNLPHRWEVSATFLQWNKINIELHWKLCSLRNFHNIFVHVAQSVDNFRAVIVYANLQTRSGCLGASLYSTICWWESKPFKLARQLACGRWLSLPLNASRKGLWVVQHDYRNSLKSFRRLLVAHCHLDERLHYPKRWKFALGWSYISSATHRRERRELSRFSFRRHNFVLKSSRAIAAWMGSKTRK